ncbi:MAG: 2-C-methyl-D-erythritol 4-phosphate cytidylyltransferase [Oscillospiraceae bacterium]|nr:2-C-methyl-D-erythritol 4-phosphate cytidylyltransferase [Oscillospiraceae bacterium]
MNLSKLAGALVKAKRPYCTAVIVAAGSSSRMGGTDKLSASLGGKPVLLRTLQVFQDCPCIDEIVVVVRQERIIGADALCRANDLDKVSAIVAGGETRAESVLAGLESANKKARLAAIHDGARPLVTREIIERTVHKAAQVGAAAPAIPLKDTIKRVGKGVVVETPPREELVGIQTPQVFDKDFIEGALFQALEQGILLTDDCSAAERLGMAVHLTEGSEKNVKITTPLDLALANLIWEERQV